MSGLLQRDHTEKVTGTIKKISIILPNARGGGAERLAIYLANDWVARGYLVDVIFLKMEGELLPLLGPSVCVTGLNVDRIKSSIWPLRNHLKRTRPDVVWVGMWPLTSAAVIAWLFAERPGKLYLIDHVQLSISCVRELGISKLLLGIVMKITYPFASGVMAVSKGVAADICRLSGFAENRIKVIYNPSARAVTGELASSALREQLWGRGFKYHILSVGEFKSQKNHALLIRAFATLPRALNAKLTILGEGNLRRVMEQQIAELGLQERVSLPGFFLDPYPWFRSADQFVLSSDWEGLPTVLIEALECGVPIVSTDCPSGPAEILEDGRYGRLVPVGDADALAVGMIKCMNEVSDREALMNRAKDFSVERISDLYLDYFAEQYSNEQISTAKKN